MPPVRTSRNLFHRVVLVPASPTSSQARGDDLVRRYRLARLRLDGREATAAKASRRGSAGS